MKYKIIVDKQSRTNPSNEKKEYEIDIEELRFKGNVYDSLVITKDEDYVLRRLKLTEFYVLEELEEPIKEPLKNINIELFEGDNYIYLIDMVGNKFYAEYLIKNEFNDIYVTLNQMHSAINQSASEVEIAVNQKLQSYSTTEEMNGAIDVKANEINLEVSKKVNDADLTGANISLRINNDTSEAKIEADKININGAISANGNFKVGTDGKVECTDITINGGTINLNDTEGQGNEFQITDNSQTYKTMMGSSIFQMGFVDVLNEAGISMTTSEMTNPAITVKDTAGRYTMIQGEGITTPKLTQTSLAEKKKNFEKFNSNALNIIKQIELYKYNLKGEEDTDKKHIGFVIGDKYKYSKEITSNDNTGVDLYSFVSVCCKAIQEQQEQINKLQSKIEKLEARGWRKKRFKMEH